MHAVTACSDTCGYRIQARPALQHLPASAKQVLRMLGAGLPRDDVILRQEYYEDMLNNANKLELTLMAVTARPLPLAGMRDALLERVELNMRQVGGHPWPLSFFCLLLYEACPASEVIETPEAHARHPQPCARGCLFCGLTNGMRARQMAWAAVVHCSNGRFSGWCAGAAPSCAGHGGRAAGGQGGAGIPAQLHHGCRSCSRTASCCSCSCTCPPARNTQAAPSAG